MNSYRTAVATGLSLFVAVFYFFDPYQQVRPVGDSAESFSVQAGEPSIPLLPPLQVTPGEQYRVTCRAVWTDTRGDPVWGWKTARVIFASFDETGRWVPSNHGVCSGTGSGSETFTQVFTIPDRAMTVRFELQHLGVAGRMGIESFSVQQVDLRRSTRWVFGGLIGIWFFLAVWSVRKLRLFRRPWGRAVFISAFLIAVGMLLPGRILGDAKSQVADWVQPAAPPATPPPAVDQSDPAPAPVAPLPPTAIQTARLRVEQLIRRIDPHLWGHLSFFFLLGVTCGLCFLPKAPPRGLLLRVLLGGLLYSVAAELLQVAELSRSVRIGDVGLNLLGFVVGLAFLCVAAPAAAEFLTETRRARRSLGG